jgi:hypothetical protein
MYSYILSKQQNMNCIKCGVKIPEARLKAIPGTVTCVKHSSASKLVGVPVNLGQGDHCYTELAIMDAETFDKFERLRTGRGKANGVGNSISEMNE